MDINIVSGFDGSQADIHVQKRSMFAFTINRFIDYPEISRVHDFCKKY
jgi:hypothetical protein